MSDIDALAEQIRFALERHQARKVELVDELAGIDAVIARIEAAHRVLTVQLDEPAPVVIPERPQPILRAEGRRYDDDEVVACARAAFDRDESMSKALEARFGMTRSSADQKLSALRKIRDDVPRARTATEPRPLPVSAPSRTIPPLALAAHPERFTVPSGPWTAEQALAAIEAEG